MSPRIVVGLTLAIGSAWFFLLYQSWQMYHLPMSQMWMPPTRLTEWTHSDFAWVFGMWTVMMAAMMLPSAIPMLTAFLRYCQRDFDANDWRVLWFASGYLAVWIMFSIALTLAQWLFHG